MTVSSDILKKLGKVILTFPITVHLRTREKFGLKITMVIGFFILGSSGILFYLNTSVNGSYWSSVFLALLLAALGNALAYLPATTAAVSNAKTEESCLASGLYNTTYQIGSALWLAIMVAIAGATTASSDAGNPITALRV
jgi:MFS family permease